MITKDMNKWGLGFLALGMVGGVVTPFATQLMVVEASTSTHKTSTDLNMREGNSTNHKVISVLKKGTSVTYISTHGTWFKVIAGGKTGYVSSSYLSKIAPTPAVTPKASAKEQLKTSANLNMRAGASTSHKILTTLNKGTVVTIETKSGTWCKVVANGKTGWVSSAYLEKVNKAPTPTPTSNTIKTVNGVMIVNKKFGLPSTYNPGENPTARKAINQMIADAKKQGVTLNAFSGYRTYAYQSTLYNNYVKKHGQAQADRFSAKPGHSEHQTGLAFDLGGADSKKWAEDSFAGTKEAKWIANNAHKYGYVIRYPQGKEHITGYKYEPWHVRYVGSVDMATKIKNSGKTLEEYFNVPGK